MEVRRGVRAEKMGDEFGTFSVTRNRFLLFLLWQTVHPTVVYLVLFNIKTMISSYSTTLFASVCYFLLLQISFLVFSIPLLLISSPRYHPGASPIDFLLQLLRGQTLPRLRTSFCVFVISSGVSASLALICLCASHSHSHSQDFVAIGIRGFVVGFTYGSHHRKRVYDFPIIQLPSLFHYKLGVPKAIIKAVKLSTDVYLRTLFVLMPIFSIAPRHEGPVSMGNLIVEHILFCCACVVVFICWELNRHLLQVFLTRRLLFVPPKVDTNPTYYLLGALENRYSFAHVRHLAYLDLYMVSQSNVGDTWRRDAIFEGTGEVYKRVTNVCLEPLENLTLNLTHYIESRSFSLTEPKAFNEYQVCAWCARTASSLTVGSKESSRGSYFTRWHSMTATITTLLAALLAVESYILKNTHLQVTNQEHHLSSYSISMADILRTSLYRVVSAFREEMETKSRCGTLGTFLITSPPPLYGTHELLVEKLQLLLDFKA